MKFEYTSYLLPLLFAAIVSASIAIYAWTRHSVPGALALCLMSFAVFEWAVGYSLEIAGISLETKYFWGVLEYIGIALAPYAWFLFSLAYSGQTKPILSY